MLQKSFKTFKTFMTKSIFKNDPKTKKTSALIFKFYSGLFDYVYKKTVKMRI